MPGLLDSLRMQSSGGILSKFTSGGGILSSQTGLLQSRLATAQAATGGPLAKVQAVMSNASTTLGARLRTSGGLLSGLGAGSSSSSSSSTAAQGAPAFQVSSAARVYSSPGPPPGIEYR